VFGRPKSELQPIPLTLLRQREPDAYRLDRGDVLSVYAEDVLGVRGQQIPVQLNPNPNAPSPTIQGFPIAVQDDGTILLPDLPPINVRGKTLVEVRELIIRMITGDPTLPGSKKLVVKGQEKVLVDLIQPRRYRVLVVREDTQPVLGAGGGFGGVVGGNKKGAGFTVLLEAYNNDLLEALNRTGGPPGLDAKNEVVIRRGQYDPNDPAKGFVRIPLRARPDEPLTFTERDIILNDGDTVFIEARDTEVYYIAGLPGAAQLPLPRDYDLRVIEALAQVRAPLINGSFQNNAFVASAVNSGIGNPNPSLVTVVRHLPCGQTILIRVDVNLAFRDQRENIIILPGDYIVMQETPGEALTRYFTQTFRLNTFFTTIRRNDLIQTGTLNNP
jgi:protein involved in polysaccharide export with SLBB domain